VGEKAPEIGACEAVTVGGLGRIDADLAIFMELFVFSDLNEVRFIMAQLLCQQMRIALRC
jgi:hypothetical protein